MTTTIPIATQVNRTEATLNHFDKSYEFYLNDVADHGFFRTMRARYRPEQADDG